MNIDLRLGDCLDVLKTIPDNSIDAVITDPPYHLTSIVKRFGKEDSAPAQFGTDGAYARASKGFMGKEWDGGDIAFRTDVWSECLRVLKPGGHLLAFSHSRTYHRMAVAVEDAGFEIRDQIMWVYGSGFPKSHNIGKAIQKQSGDIKVIGTKQGAGTTGKSYISNNEEYVDGEKGVFKKQYDEIEINNDWEGWGTALKPAHEPIVMARKPLSEKSIAENVLKHGTGGINIDGSRIGTDEITTNSYGDKGFVAQEGYEPSTHQGRFPANIIFDEEAGQLLDQQSGPTSQGHWAKTKTTGFGEFGNGKSEYKGVGPKDKNKDKAGASRFFYCAKAGKKDRNEGLDNFTPKTDRQKGHGIDRICGICGTSMLKPQDCNCEEPDWITPPKLNHHPTVKPTDLMRYLINLVTPPNGTILDPFMGSGSTGKAAVRCGVNFIGIEKEQEYMDIASARIEHEKNKPIQTKLFDASK
jgi:site-specific DNA-methyltransferase (adenine-specific)